MWTNAKNNRRYELILLSEDRELDPGESAELEQLTKEVDEHVDKLYPLKPFDKLEELYDKLKLKEQQSPT